MALFRYRIPPFSVGSRQIIAVFYQSYPYRIAVDSWLVEGSTFVDVTVEVCVLYNMSSGLYNLAPSAPQEASA